MKIHLPIPALTLLAALVAAGVCIGASGGPAHADFRLMVSPGPLSRPHQALDKQCDKCHVPFQGTPAARCLDCHPHTAEQLRTGKGFHAPLRERKCASCHGDHKGRDFQMSPPMTGKDFDHAVTGFVLTGKHQRTSCAGCHKAVGGVIKWVGSPTSCVGCHTDTHHRGTLGKDCAACHGTVTFKPPPRHDIAEHRLPMSGGHQGRACVDCHRSGAHMSATSGCGDCHEQKHGGTKAPCATCHNVNDWKQATFTHDFCTCILPGKHQTAPCLSCHPAFRFTPTPFACASCHLKDRKHEDLGPCSQCHSALSWKQKAFNHNKKVFGFPITGEHLKLGCENCHKRQGFFRGEPRACEGCHKVPRHGDFGPCAPCHTTAGFSPQTFSHDKTRFRLDGAHVKVACEVCHGRFQKGTFVPGPNACVLCHGNPHKGQFEQQKKAQVGGARGAGALLAFAGSLSRLALDLASVHAVGDRWKCLDCHTAQAWKPSTVGVEQHEKFSFPLRGAHARVACASCHAGGRFVNTPTQCASCHTDPHAGKLGAACQGCHGEQSFQPATVGVEQHQKFSFPLRGAHVKVACASCHKDDLFVTTPAQCASCHADLHRGRLGTACQGCHAETGWKDTGFFNHRGKTGFALDNGHGRPVCADCHGQDHRRLLPFRAVTCLTCHKPAHGKQFGLDCVSCHKTTRFSDMYPFRHDEKTGFPLERRHSAVKCLTCHDVRKGERLNGACQTCHGDPHRGGTGTACGDCHRADRWTLIHFDHDRTEFPLRGRHFVTACLWCHRNEQWTATRSECIACHARDRRQDALHASLVDCGQAGCHTPFDLADVLKGDWLSGGFSALAGFVLPAPRFTFSP